ncbi:MAG: hypothetical protein H6737_29395 [Alphaproteobacteria bacterium]|nr:hypothetical protein [Alphaproteobacteria bacterium]
MRRLFLLATTFVLLTGCGLFSRSAPPPEPDSTKRMAPPAQPPEEPKPEMADTGNADQGEDE